MGKFDGRHVDNSVESTNNATNISNNDTDISDLQDKDINTREKESSLNMLLHPSQDGAWKDIYKSGFKPAFYNQQWGGAHWGQLPDGSWGDIATGYVVSDSQTSLGSAAGSTHTSNGFKVSENIVIKSIWIRLFKVGDPVNSLELYIYDDNGGNPNAAITNGMAVSQSGKLHTSNGDGGWVKFVFSINPSLVANTQYHWVVKSSGAVNASNYWRLNVGLLSGYPYGNRRGGDATPTWTSQSGSLIFLIVAESSSQFLQKDNSLDISDAKLVCGEGNPINQSKGLTQPLKNFFDDKEFTYMVRGEAFTKDKTISDFLYGLDHDRIAFSSNVTTGHPQVDLYETDGTKHTVTGTTDISVASKFDLTIRARMKNDGSDYLRLYVNGVEEGTALTSQSFEMDHNMKELGTAWIGGGFPLAPTWTQDLDMSVLPSSAGWTWLGAATESDAMSVSGGKLYQNKNGYGNDDGYYRKILTLNNSNGWIVEFKVNVLETEFTSTESCFYIADGTKIIGIHMYESYIQTVLLSINTTHQMSLADKEHTFTAIGKGSDIFIFIDNKLILDGTGLFTTGSGNNRIDFGDQNLDSDVNADVIWDYVKYYEGSALLPQFTSAEIHEVGFWSGDKSVLLPLLYNEGTRRSIKEFCGVKKNYVKAIGLVESRKGVVSDPSSTSTSNVLIDDMELFVLSYGKSLISMDGIFSNSSSDYHTRSSIKIDGVEGDIYATHNSKVDGHRQISLKAVMDDFTGLHKIEVGMATQNGGTVKAEGKIRLLTVSQKGEDEN